MADQKLVTPNSVLQYVHFHVFSSPSRILRRHDRDFAGLEYDDMHATFDLLLNEYKMMRAASDYPARIPKPFVLPAFGIKRKEGLLVKEGKKGSRGYVCRQKEGPEMVILQHRGTRNSLTATWEDNVGKNLQAAVGIVLRPTHRKCPEDTEGTISICLIPGRGASILSFLMESCLLFWCPNYRRESFNLNELTEKYFPESPVVVNWARAIGSRQPSTKDIETLSNLLPLSVTQKKNLLTFWQQVQQRAPQEPTEIPTPPQSLAMPLVFNAEAHFRPGTKTTWSIEEKIHFSAEAFPHLVNIKWENEELDFQVVASLLCDLYAAIRSLEESDPFWLEVEYKARCLHEMIRAWRREHL